MLRIRGIKVKLDEKLEDVLYEKYKVKEYKINKKSLDARNKKNIFYVYEVDVNLPSKYINNKNIFKTPNEVYVYPKPILKENPIIVGAGPAGLFCAYILCENGFKPIIVDRGEDIDNRVKTVDEFWENNILNKNSNVQYGEGGAGTFSDGKLNTLVKDKNFIMKKVFETFVKFGAPEEIMYVNNPHIGTDKLRKVIKNMRKKIIEMGGIFKFNTKLDDIVIEDNKLKYIILNKEKIKCSKLVLAIGNSSRDTFEMLYKKNIQMTSKPFAIGIRIMHSQDFINKAQYGNNNLPPASYKLTYNNERGVYTFCNCPGGYVINASSEENRLVINGMSNYNRDSGYSNSAIVVSITKDDFGNNPLDGIEFQRRLEKKAYKLGDGKIPVQIYSDYKLNKTTSSFKNIKPIFKGKTSFANINEIFPDYINNYLKEGIDHFDTKIKDFSKDAVISAPETRTSSPVRILRNEKYQSNVEGIYPCGEGAGYAGGITTSAMDGIKVAQAIGGYYEKRN